MMERYRITFVNPAFSPRPSYEIVRADSETEAVRLFRERVNQACVVKSIGDRGVGLVERLKGGA